MTAAALVLAMLELAGAPPRDRITLARAQRLAPVILAEAARVSPPFDPVLLAAVAWNESSFSEHSTGSAGEVGVFQVHPKGMALYLCRDLQVHQLAHNVRCALRILAHARRACGGEPARWLSAYNGRSCSPSGYSYRVLNLRRKVR